MNNNILSEKFLRLVQIMDELRAQCPWDKKQTIHTLRTMTIEETYELADAIDKENWQEIKEELGDLMLHLLFYSKIGSEQTHFSFVDVLETITEKMIKRHPHIYGNVVVENEADVKRNWQKIKLEKEGKKSVLSGVPAALPSIAKAARIQEKAKQVGFEWENKTQVWEKVEEELNELKQAENTGNAQETEEEFGDVFFSLINYARFLNIDADAALEKCNRKFIKRFQLMETYAGDNNQSLTEMSLDEMDELWNKAKAQTRNKD
ncbi:nucleoside triphosphate pyrophosphohydrolase [Arachidicoccus ginsenosidimutans]|uniref:nucleoside triphosphate pyrophosphohydrolase n=1 Tax=Arachidicoccus sp. BS20 TaxID=1850526 RepID=UPI0007F151C2|nr:nucleoside triphosphate pyrophosphohydrolase [Arachidicoccus sp. BS20]ANI87988.1 nucleoside triphosphate pyrophosphohydrolase [Arachidicoccus sp. BS20]